MELSFLPLLPSLSLSLSLSTQIHCFSDSDCQPQFDDMKRSLDHFEISDDEWEEHSSSFKPSRVLKKSRTPTPAAIESFAYQKRRVSDNDSDCVEIKDDSDDDCVEIKNDLEDDDVVEEVRWPVTRGRRFVVEDEDSDGDWPPLRFGFESLVAPPPNPLLSLLQLLLLLPNPNPFPLSHNALTTPTHFGSTHALHHLSTSTGGQSPSGFPSSWCGFHWFFGYIASKARGPQKAEIRKNEWRYFVHYLGWNKRMLKAKSLLMKKTGNKPSAKNVTTELQLEHPSQQQKRQPQQPGNRQPQDPAKRQPQQPAKRQPQPPQLQQLEASQQRQPQPPLRSSESADHDMSSKGKKTRGVTKGIGTHDIVIAANERILIQMNEDQKLPNGVQANSRFVSEIGSRTRSLAPLHVKKWKEVTLEDKDEITKGLLFGDRDISDWEWLCDNLYTDQAYQNRCRINTINRNRKIYNHCGGSRPFTKHMEAEEQKGKNVTFIENWSLMHQHRGNNGGVWINEEAEKTGKKLTGEFIKTKQQLADSEGTPFEDVIVPIPVQLDILAKELGTMNGKTIRGVGYGLKKDTFCPSVTGSTSNPTNAQLMRYIVLLERATCFS